jgi:hypothetical protein
MKLSEKMVELAKKEIGVEEVNGTNCGPRVDEYKSATWLNPKRGWPWCFDESVNILTEKGWRNLKELVLNKEKIKVAQVDQETLDISFDYPTDYIQKTTDESSRIKTRSIDLICDKNHEFFGAKNSKNAVPDLISLSEINSMISVPSCFIESKYNAQYSEQMLDFLAAFVADGFFHQRSDNHKKKIRIQVSKQRKIDCLKLHGGTSYTSNKIYGDSKSPLTTFEFDVPNYFAEVFDDYKNFKWDWVYSLCAEQMEFFLERYCFWDGTISKKTISTARKQNHDVFCAMAIMAGMHPNSSLRTCKSGKICYELTISKKNTRTINKSHVSTSKEKKELYCVTVPKGLIIIQDKKGTPLLTGNCAAFICWLFREAMKGGKYTFKRPRTAGAWDFENWCRQQDSSVTLKKPHKGDIKAGDIVIFTFSHIGIATGPPDKNGLVPTIEGNTDAAGSREGGGVFAKKRKLSQIRSIIRANV